MAEETKFLTPGQLAIRLGLSVHTLADWRHRDKGPRWIQLTESKFGRVRYRLEDVVVWEAFRSAPPRAP
jgi:hypothetical protein